MTPTIPPAVGGAAPWEGAEARLAAGHAALVQRCAGLLEEWRAEDSAEPPDAWIDQWDDERDAPGDLSSAPDSVPGDWVEEYAAAKAAEAVARVLRARSALDATADGAALAGDLRAARVPAPTADEKAALVSELRAAGPSGVPGAVADLAVDLRLLADSVGAEAQAFRNRSTVLARLAGHVVRVAGDTRGSTPWTQLVREVAVSLHTSDQAARHELDTSLLAHRAMPTLLAALDGGRLPVAQARELLATALGCTDPEFVAASPDGGASAIAAVDALAAKAAAYRSWSVSRVRQEARAAVLRADADAVAARTAQRAASREVRLRTRTERGADVLPSDTAELVLDGPALVLQQALQALDADARALQGWLRESGDRRGLDQLRFDLAVHRLLGRHAPVLPVDSPGAGPLWERFQSAVGADRLPDPTSPSWWTDRRFTRPVQLQPLVPVTTLLGLSQEPGWVPGLGWGSAPTVRQLLPVAELRQVCVDSATGQVVDLADRPLRPPPGLDGVRQALTGMCTGPFPITSKTWQAQPHYRPSPALEEFVRLRDGFDDGPTGSTAQGGDLDHDQAYDHRQPDRGGPTAAWNLPLRGRRTHVLKHDGWVPQRVEGGTWWTSPLGQTRFAPAWRQPLEPLVAGARLPDPQALHDLEAELLRPPTEDDVPPPF